MLKISYVVAASKMLAQKQYHLWRHDRPSVVVHWLLCERYGISTGTKWYEHKPERVLEKEKAKALCDFSVQTNHELKHNKPCISNFEKETGEYHITDVACLFDPRRKQKEKQKVVSYIELMRKIRGLFQCRAVALIRIIIRALDRIGKGF